MLEKKKKNNGGMKEDYRIILANKIAIRCIERYAKIKKNKKKIQNWEREKKNGDFWKKRESNN